MAAYCLAAVLAVSLLASQFVQAAHSRISQEPPFECPNVIGAEPFDDLVKRVVAVAENQAFLATQSTPATLYPTSVLPVTGKLELQKPGA